jgi:L-asparaginase
MVPYSIDPVEATANLSSAYGYINALEQEGVFIAMNGVMGPYEKVKKDRTKGRFSLQL